MAATTVRAAMAEDLDEMPEVHAVIEHQHGHVKSEHNSVGTGGNAGRSGWRRGAPVGNHIG